MQVRMKCSPTNPVECFTTTIPTAGWEQITIIPLKKANSRY